MSDSPSIQEQTHKAIARGDAQAHALWVILTNENDRDGYALKPLQWDGIGEYQHISFRDGRDGFVRVGDRPFRIVKSDACLATPTK